MALKKKNVKIMKGERKRRRRRGRKEDDAGKKDGKAKRVKFRKKERER